MAYADRNVGGTRVVAIVVVSVLVFAMGYAFVNGLTYNYVKKMALSSTQGPGVGVETSTIMGG